MSDIKQLTAVTKFRNEIARLLPTDLDEDICKRLYMAYEKARQEEQNQIRTAYQVGLYDSSMPRNERFDNGLDYYNQTYRQ